MRVAVEALNRCETHLVNTAAQALAYVEAVGSPMVGIELDAYHMNIEEADPRAAISGVAGKLLAFHVADSSRAGLGRGHLDLRPHLVALRSIDYHGSVVVECTAPGPDPFRAIKDRDSLETVQRYAAETIRRLRALMGEGQPA